jgi:hypothetical protein
VPYEIDPHEHMLPAANPPFKCQDFGAYAATEARRSCPNE